MLSPPAGSNGACISCTQQGSRGLQHHGLAGVVHPSQTFWISISKKGNSTYSCPKRRLHQGRREGRGIQLLRCQWLHVQHPRIFLGPGLTNTHTAPCDQHWPYCGSCSTGSTSARKCSEFKHKTSAVLLQRNRQPANLTSSYSNTAVMTMNVF